MNLEDTHVSNPDLLAKSNITALKIQNESTTVSTTTLEPLILEKSPVKNEENRKSIKEPIEEDQYEIDLNDYETGLNENETDLKEYETGLNENETDLYEYENESLSD